jgi:hypothetical protein
VNLYHRRTGGFDIGDKSHVALTGGADPVVVDGPCLAVCFGCPDAAFQFSTPRFGKCRLCPPARRFGQQMPGLARDLSGRGDSRDIGPLAIRDPQEAGLHRPWTEAALRTAPTRIMGTVALPRGVIGPLIVA